MQLLLKDTVSFPATLMHEFLRLGAQMPQAILPSSIKVMHSMILKLITLLK